MTLTNYWWLLLWPIIMWICNRLLRFEKEEYVNGQKCIRWSWIGVIIFLIPLVIWAGWRPNNVGDTGVYRGNFLDMPVGLENLPNYLSTREKGKGFVVFECFLKTFVSKSDIVFFLIASAIQLILLAAIYRKYSLDFWMSMFLFIASAEYLSWVFNGMRQFMAVVLIFAAIPLIVKKQYFWIVIVVLFAALFHSAALIFLPFIFIINGKAWNWKTLLFIAGIIITVIFIERVSGFIVSSMEDTTYESDIDLYLNDDGTNIIRVLFYSIPTVMSWLFRKYIDAANDPFINICTNLSIISTGIYVISHFTSGLLIGAVPIFFSLTNYILIPWIIQKVFSEKSAALIKSIFFVVYTVFFYYQCGPTWGLL